MSESPFKPETLRRYQQERQNIHDTLDYIMVVTSILSQYKDCRGDEVLVDVYAIGFIHEELNARATDLMDRIDNVLPYFMGMEAPSDTEH